MCYQSTGSIVHPGPIPVPTTYLAVAGSGDNATAVGLYSAIVTALYRRERTGKGSAVTTSLLAEGVWSASGFDQGRAERGEVLRAARSQEPGECGAERDRAAMTSGSFSSSHRTSWRLSRKPLAARPPDRPAILRSGQAGGKHAPAHGILDEVFGAQRWPIGLRSSAASTSRLAPVRGSRGSDQRPALRLE